MRLEINWFLQTFVFEREMNENLKKLVPANNKQNLIESFYLSQPIYDMTPPVPLSYPKIIHYPLDAARHFGHKFNPSFIHASKPLLIGSDVGMQLDELMLFAKQCQNQNQVLDEEDEMLLNETIMNVSYNISGQNKTNQSQNGNKIEQQAAVVARPT